MPTIPASSAPAPARLRHRRNARTLTAGQLANLRRAIAAARPVRPAPVAPADPASKTVIVTEAFKRIVAPADETMTVTVVAFVPGAQAHDVLQFDTIRLLTYE